MGAGARSAAQRSTNTPTTYVRRLSTSESGARMRALPIKFPSALHDRQLELCCFKPPLQRKVQRSACPLKPASQPALESQSSHTTACYSPTIPPPPDNPLAIIPPPSKLISPSSHNVQGILLQRCVRAHHQGKQDRVAIHNLEYHTRKATKLTPPKERPLHGHPRQGLRLHQYVPPALQ